MVEFRYFLSSPTKKFSPKRRKTKGRNWASFLDESAHVQLHMSFTQIAFLLTFFFLYLLLIYWAGLSDILFFFLFCLDVIFFFYGHVFLFFGFNCASFFNRDIYINLYKLTFSIPLFFHSQPNKNEEN